MLKKLFYFVVILALGGAVLVACKKTEPQSASVITPPQPPAVNEEAAQPETTTGTYQDELKNAQKTIKELKQAIEEYKTQTTSYNMLNLLIPVANAQDEGAGTVEEATPADTGTAPEPQLVAETPSPETTIQDLTARLTQELNAAVQTAEAAGSTEEVQEAMELVSEVQDEAVDTLESAAEVVESDDVTEVVADAIEDTSAQQEQVDTAVNNLETTLESGTPATPVNIEDISAISERNKAERQGNIQEKATQAMEKQKAYINELIAAGASDEEVAKAEAVLEDIQVAIEAGKYGRAFGRARSAAAHADHRKRVEARKGKRLDQAQGFLDKASAHLAELMVKGATAKEIEAFEGKLASLQQAVESGDLKSLRAARHDARKERIKLKDMANKAGELTEEEVAKLKDAAQKKGDEFKAGWEAKKQEFTAKRDEVKKVLDDEVIQLKARAQERIQQVETRAATRVEEVKARAGKMIERAKTRAENLGEAAKIKVDNKIERIKNKIGNKIERVENKAEAVTNKIDNKAERVNERREAVRDRMKGRQ